VLSPSLLRRWTPVLLTLLALWAVAEVAALAVGARY
jgi:hypothetical protein